MSFCCDTCGHRYARNYKRCPHCDDVRHHYEPTEAEIAAACVAIRQAWPEVKLLHCEGYVECEVPTARRVTDHMRRKWEAEG